MFLKVIIQYPIYLHEISLGLPFSKKNPFPGWEAIPATYSECHYMVILMLNDSCQDAVKGFPHKAQSLHQRYQR